MSKWKLSNDGFGLNLLNLPYAPRFATFSRGVMPAAETEELARLLSAAPEMLDALKLVDGHYRRFRDGFKLSAGDVPNSKAAHFIEQLDAYLGALQAAIAKADGNAQQVSI